MSGKPLSVAMHRTMRAVRNRPGLPGGEYLGGWRTIDALRRRKLVHVDRGGSVMPTEAGAQMHLHEFKLTMHLDGCHYYSTVATCECGASYGSYGERDVKNDPYSAIWMEPSDPEAAACLRCEELMNGARPRYREQITEPKAKAAA